LDKKVIGARLKKLNHAVARLKKMKEISAAAFERNQDYQDIVERNFQVAIQTCIDIANYLIAGANLTAPDEEENIFILLGRNKIIPLKLAEQIKGMVGFRNILVHDYLEIETAQVYDLLQKRLTDFDKFARVIVEYLDKK